MSHLKERKEKICLNCKAELYGRFCHVCGQENLEPKETVWHLVQHFFNDVTHFDGKFFETVRYLLRKPGFLSTEYMIGRRATYLNPIRMYVFTSAIFFIILFSLKKPEDMIGHEKKEKETSQGLPALKARQAQLEKSMAETKDEEDREDYRTSLQPVNIEIAAIRKQYGDSTKKIFSKTDLKDLLLQSYGDSISNASLSAEDRDRIVAAMKVIGKPVSLGNFLNFGQPQYSSIEQYDSTEKAQPDSLRDGWLKVRFMHRLILNQEAYQEDPRRYKEHFIENMLHSFPKILFWSLPIFAMILNILYFRHKKTYYYVDHGIFTIHVYCATFILILIMMLLSQLSNAIQIGWVQIVDLILMFAVCLYMMIYLYKAMRGFYKQGRAKTFVKYFIVCWLAFFVNVILLAVFFLFSLLVV